MRYLQASLLIATAAVALSTGVANASLIINPNNGIVTEAQNEPETNNPGAPGFPCTACVAFPQTTIGYQHDAGLLAADAGWYRFTYYGSGNAAIASTFSVAGGGTFVSSGGGSTLYDSFEVFLPGGLIPFTFTNTSTGCTVSNGGNPSTPEGCHYLVALENSPGPTPATGPQGVAYLGFSDLPEGIDKDFQDLVVRVEQVPVPATLALFGASLLGLGFARRRTA